MSQYLRATTNLVGTIKSFTSINKKACFLTMPASILTHFNRYTFFFDSTLNRRIESVTSILFDKDLIKIVKVLEYKLVFKV
jgi:hypothetical protein